jgi:rod shape-determining protein MreC
MAVYSAGRRRTIIVLLLTTVLLITLDLRGNAVFDAARSGFGYALRPFEIAGEVVTRPVVRVWEGITRVDDLERENERLQRQIDAQRSAELAGRNALIENRQLRALLGLESLGQYDAVAGEIIGGLPSNYDQRVEINKGSSVGIRVGMPVVNEAGLVGRITQVSPDTSIVMLVTDPNYHVQVKVVGENQPDTTTTVPETVPSGLDVDDVTTTTSTTTTTTVPGEPDEAGLGGATGTGDTVTTAPPDGEAAPGAGTTTTTSTSSTTTTTLPPVTRETGDLAGQGAGNLPRIRFVADTALFGGRVQVGDDVLTTGGSVSLAPPGIPVGEVANIIDLRGSGGVELEVELSADLGRLSFLTVVLYQPPTELGSE